MCASSIARPSGRLPTRTLTLASPSSHGSPRSSGASWSGPDDIKTRYPSASFLAGNRVVFNIKGNKYRVIVAIKYEFFAAYIRFIGTHAEYDAIDAGTI
jgi:mRNA interferase HigB